MKRFVFPVVLCASFVGSAQNVPQQLAVSARLSNAGAPLTGSHTVLTRLFDSLTGGSELWSESALANADNGLVTLMLGAQSPLSPAVLDGRPLFVEFIVDGQVLSPRLPVVSVPYAVRSSVSASAATLPGVNYTYPLATITPPHRLTCESLLPRRRSRVGVAVRW
ncbi:MAG: hypothetical protein AB1730_24875 [Myxococcota bacterium]